MSTHLQEFFGFSADPFNLTPDPKFLYLAVGHYETLSSMMSGIKERKGITMISGEVGTGKTTLIYALLNELSEKIRTAFVFYTKISFEDLLKSILTDLEVPVSGKNLTTLLVLFRQYLKERMVKDETVAIVIDEAQHLELEVMENLFRLCSEESSFGNVVQILLVGQPELEAKLDSKEMQAFKKRVTVRNRLRPLNQKESGEYINHRLKVVGSSSSKVFTPEAVDRISRFSHGIPRVINILCDRALLAGYADTVRKIDEAIVKETIREVSHLQFHETVSPRGVYTRYAILVIVILAVLGLGTLYFFSRSPNVKPSLKRNEKTVPLEKGSIKKEKPAEKGRPPEKPTERIVSVEKGWTLSSLAQQYYHDVNPTLIDLILRFNPEITDLNRIFVSQQIKIPDITEGLLLIQASDQSYRIYLGTFDNEQAGYALGKTPILKGKNLEVVPHKVSPRATWFRVFIGNYKTREESLKIIQTLRRQGLLPAFAGSSK
jgi:general secretion pathway protein A